MTQSHNAKGPGVSAGAFFDDPRKDQLVAGAASAGAGDSDAMNA